MRRILTGGLLLFPLAPAVLAQMGSLSELDNELTRTVSRVAQAVVEVEPGVSGVCVAEEGFILTDASVSSAISRSDQGTVRVTFPHKGSFDAELHAADTVTRTLILRVVGRGRFPAVRPGDPGALQVGHFLMTVGNAFGTARENAPAVTLGVVASIRRDRQGRALLLETSAATNPGQNGGPYFDTDGKLVGLFRSLPTDQDLATVTPIDRIRQAYRQANGAERIFDTVSKLQPPRSKAGILSRAFHIAATRARHLLVTIRVKRAEPADPSPASAEPAADLEGEKKDPNASKRPGPSLPERKGAVSGTIIDPDGFVLAPAGAFAGEIESIEVLLADERRFRATLISTDRKAGLALLLLDRKANELLPRLEERHQDQLELGQFVLAIGAPHGPPVERDPFVTVGLLSARHRLDAYRDALQTDAGINVKNAGGLLIDLRGRPLGVLLPPALPYGQNSGLGFAMPLDALRTNLERMKEGRDIEPAYIGVTLSDAPGEAGGILVNGVSKGMPGEKAGLLAGDVITRLDGRPSPSRQFLSDYLARHKTAGEHLQLTVRRGDERLLLQVILTRRP